jgi:hypothetical protein
MLKSVAMSSLAIALGLTAWLLPMRGEQATAQSGPLHILVVEYDIVPGEIDKYLTAVKELGVAWRRASANSISRSRKTTRTTFCCLRRGTTRRRTLPTSPLIVSKNTRQQLET